MNNSAFSSDPHQWSNRAKALIQRDWDISFSVVAKLIEMGSSLKPITTKTFVEVRIFRNYLNNTLQSALQRIAKLASLKDRLLDMEAQLVALQQGMNRNRNFTYQKTEYHQKHFFAPSTEKMLCGACRSTGKIMGAPCRDCYGKGSMMITDKFLQSKTVPRIVEAINEEMKTAFDHCHHEHAKLSTWLNSVRQEKQDISYDIGKIAQEVEAKCQVIKRICSRFSFRDECDSLIEQFKLSATSMEDVEQKNQTRELVRSLTELATKLEPATAVLQNAGFTCVHLTG
jgi:hypothetical protein